RMVHPDPRRPRRVMMDAIDIHEMPRRRDHRALYVGVTRSSEREGENLRGVVLEVAPRVTALRVVVIAGKIPIAEVPHPVGAVARSLAARTGASHRPAVVPLLTVIAP